jgi:rhodanese-related sulfurtransferase
MRQLRLTSAGRPHALSFAALNPETVRQRSPDRFWTSVLLLGLAFGSFWQLLPTAVAQPKGLQATVAEKGFSTITSAQLATMLQNKDFLFVNVHIPYEGEIKDTDALIAFDKIAENLDRLPQDKGAKIVLYCRSGRMSEIAAGQLVRLGYTHISHLRGGMIDWKANGYEIAER